MSDVRGNKDFYKNEIQNVVAHNVIEGSFPANPKAGQIIYNVTKGLFMWYDGVHSKWVGGGVGALKAKGSLDKDISPATDTIKIDLPTSNVELGDAWFVVKAGTYNNGAQACTVGDWFFCAAVNDNGTNPTWNYVPAGNGSVVLTFTYDALHPTQNSWTFTNTLATSDVQISVYRVVTIDSTTHNYLMDCDIDVTNSTVYASFGEAPTVDESFKIVMTMG